MRSLWRDRNGNITVMFGVISSILLGLVAMSIDLGNLYYNKARLQVATDAAALGGAIYLPTTSTATSTALSLTRENVPISFGSIAASADVMPGYWDAATKTFSTVPATKNALKVTGHRSLANGNPVMTFFGKFVGKSSLDTSTSSIAVMQTGTCIYVLDPTSASALHVKGNGQVQIGCPMQINSTSSTAAYVQGSGNVNASSTCVVGGYKGNGWNPAPKTGCSAQTDPLGNVPEPAQPSASCTAPSGGGTMTSNCTYTGNISLSSTTTLQSGLIYFHNANVTLGANAVVSGSNVMLFLDAGSTISFSGNVSFSITAPATGTYAGIAIFQSRSTAASVTDTIWSDSTLSIGGTVYAPSSTVSMGGNSSLTLNTGYVVARDLSLGGSSTLSFGSNTGTAARLLREHVNLVQ